MLFTEIPPDILSVNRSLKYHGWWMIWYEMESHECFFSKWFYTCCISEAINKRLLLCLQIWNVSVNCPSCGIMVKVCSVSPCFLSSPFWTTQHHCYRYYGLMHVSSLLMFRSLRSYIYIMMRQRTLCIYFFFF